MKESRIFFFLLVTLFFLFDSCSNSKYSDFQKTQTGLMYKFHSRGSDTSMHPSYGEVVRVKMAKCFGDSVMENTDLINPEGLKQFLREPAFKGAIEEGIVMMSLGDSATFLISTDSVNKYYPAKDSSKNFKPHDYLAFGIKLMNIQTVDDIKWEQEQQKKIFESERKEKETGEISQYIKDNHVEVKPTSTGLYFMESTKGKGVNPKEGDSVVVHYTGSFLNGTVFGSSLNASRPVGFVLGEKTILPGWNEAVKQMKKGSTVTIIIPSSLAFDSLGDFDNNKNKYRIPPYCPLKFDIQLIEIKSKK